MRLRLKIESDQPIVLPRSYNHLLQAWLYNQISDPAYQLFMHDEGYRYEKRTFRLFTFSRLQGSWEVDQNKKQIIFNSPVYLQIASPLIPFMQQVALTMLLGKESYWGNNRISITSLEAMPDNLPSGASKRWRIHTLSPIVVYSTLLQDGKKTTRYYRPDEAQFPISIRENLLKKAALLQAYKLGDYDSLDGDFAIKPLFDPLKKGSTALYYKNFFIQGYLGDFELECSQAWVKVVLDTGLGSKNAQGLGMVELIQKKPLTM